MGRLNNNSVGDDRRKEFLKHSSHVHHLELSSTAIPSDRATCFGCDDVVLSGMPHLSCRACGFYLHRDCYDFPERIRHPADNHVLVLNTSASASFHCKACGSNGRGFVYQCTTCRQDFHCVCTTKPLLVTNLSVHEHELRLCFESPYEGETGFKCDLCGRAGYCWLYCCQGCHFDVHIDYAKCKVARNSGTTRAVGDVSPSYQTRSINIQDSMPGNFPVVTDQVVAYHNGTNVTTTRAPINNTSLQPPVNHPQIGLNGSFGFAPSQGVRAPILGQPYANNNPVFLQPPQGNNQQMYLRPNGGAPMNIVQPNTGFGYGTPMMMTDQYHQGGMKGMFVGGIASALGQGCVSMGADALGMGGDSSMGSDFVGSYAGEWASSII